jgi:hypothetical protein
MAHCDDYDAALINVLEARGSLLAHNKSSLFQLYSNVAKCHPL